MIDTLPTELKPACPFGRNMIKAKPYTLASGIDVGPTFINFGFFSRSYGLIREYIKVI